MKKHKWSTRLAGALLAVSILMTGCGGTSADESRQADTEEAIGIVFCHNQPVGSPEDVGAQAMVEKLKKELGDRVIVELYPAQQMYDMNTQIEKVQLGEIHLTLQPTAAVSQIAEDVKVLDLPYLMPIDNEKLICEVLDGELGQELMNRIGGNGVHGLGLWYGGYKLFTTNGPEIHSPADFQGLSMRILDSPVLAAQYENWGAEAVPATYSELYSVLEDGVAHGQENPVQTIALNRYQDVQSQMVQSYHGVMHYVLLTNAEWFSGLPEHVQEAVIEAEEYGRKEARKAYAKQEADYIAALESAEGVHYYELTPEEISVFQASVQPVYDSQTAGSQWQIDYVKRLQEAFAE